VHFGLPSIGRPSTGMSGIELPRMDLVEGTGA